MHSFLFACLSVQKSGSSRQEKMFLGHGGSVGDGSKMCVLQTASFPRIFKLFRGLGLRHLVVINGDSEVSTAACVEERVTVFSSIFFLITCAGVI